MNRVDLPNEALKATPPVTVLAAPLAGVTLGDVAAALAVAFLLLQIAHLVWKWRKEYRDDKDRKP